MICTQDSETCGLYGMPVLIQYAFDEEPVQLHDVWLSPVGDTLDLLEKMADCEVLGFNIAFDWFHYCKTYTIFRLLKDMDSAPNIAEVVAREREAMHGPCLKPRNVLDIMLHARKTDLQMTMERSDIKIKRIPTVIAKALSKELEQAIEYENILFSRKGTKKGPRWAIRPSKKKDGSEDPNFRNLVLNFKASAALKAMAVHVLGIDPDEVIRYDDIEISKKLRPKELGYAPYAAATKRNWSKVIEFHTDHWFRSTKARQYAGDDVRYTRMLWHHFNRPAFGDDDSVLAALVAAVRWRGYALDIPHLQNLHDEAKAKIKAVPIYAKRAKEYIMETLSDVEKATFTSTNKVVLEGLVKAGAEAECEPCAECNFTGKLPQSETSKRAADILEARTMKLQIGMYKKLINAGRFHASFKVIGALSTRMSGADGLNAQGINRVEEVRLGFPLADDGLELHGGDFEGFEVVLADTAYNDPDLRKDLLTCERCRNVQVEKLQSERTAWEHLSPDALLVYIATQLAAEDKKLAEDQSYVPKTHDEIKQTRLRNFVCPKCGGKERMKIHALFGTFVYPGMSYDDIRKTAKTADDKYNKSKSAVFAMIYGGEAYTLMTRLGVDMETAEAAYRRFVNRYKGVGQARQRHIGDFMTMKQSGGLGGAITYSKPKDFVESLLGFRRYFTIENRTVEALVRMASELPDSLKDVKIPVMRRDRVQTAAGAVQSALYGTAFQIQAANMRAAANHEIQSTGAQITKSVQRKIWDIQPHGVHEFLVQPCNIHDEILCPTKPSHTKIVEKVVYDAVESFREKVPLIEFEWKPMATWASK